MAKRKIVIGSDHAGYECKEYIRKFLLEKGYEVIDEGTYSTESVDYPDYAHKVATKVGTDGIETGILFCGSGNGVCITANKHMHIRAALCWTVEIAELARKHNDANVLCIPARFVSCETAAEMVEKFLETGFEGGRHQRRVEGIERVQSH